MKLYSYHRSSAAYRVRIALNLKGLPYDYAAVDLLQKQQKSATYLTQNPQGLVPALETDTGELIAQSMAILEWLEEQYPEPPLLPPDPLQRAQVRSMALNIACDIHPLNNIAILDYLREELKADKARIHDWYCQWIWRGFDAIEQILASAGGDFCFGDTPTIADLCLIPQVYNADRFEVPTEQYPTIRRIYHHCGSIEAFARASPSNQPDG